MAFNSYGMIHEKDYFHGIMVRKKYESNDWIKVYFKAKIDQRPIDWNERSNII